jgi:hypothetical protein
MQERHIDADITVLTMTRAELRQFVREALLDALNDEETLNRICEQCERRTVNLTRIRAPYIPQGIEYKSSTYTERGMPVQELPEWVREG